MKTLERIRGISSTPEGELLARSAGRRRRRRRDGVAFILIVLLATVVAVVAGAGASTRSDASRRIQARTHQQRSRSILPGADTTLLTWPAGPPIFGDLPGGGPGTTVNVDNLTTGQVSLKRIPNIAGGDFPYQIVPVARRLVYNSGDGVSAIGDDLAGPHRVLGRATWFVPSVNGNVLLVYARDAYPVSVRSVSVATGAGGPIIRLPKGTNQLIYGTARGLLLFDLAPHRGSDSGTLELWRPHRTPTMLAHLPNGISGANARLVEYGSACSWRTAMLSNGPSGYQVCARLHVIDLPDGQRFSFTAPVGTIGWLSDQFGLDSGVAPHTMLVARAAIAPAGAGNGRLFVLRPGDGSSSAVPVPDSTAPFYSRTAWSIDGSSLLYQGPNARLRGFRPMGSSHPLGMRCCEYAAVVSIHSQSG